MVQKKGKANQVKNPNIKQESKISNPPKDLFDILNNFFDKYKGRILWIGLILTGLFGALLFDLKISEGTDDSGYIVAAHDFIKGKTFPSWHGSFYPIFLSLPMLIFGVNLFALKFSSFLLMLAHFIFFFAAFRNRIPSTILTFVAIIVSINSYILYHASSTFSEPLYFLLQAITIYFFLQIIDALEKKVQPSYKYWKLWLGFGLSSFLLTITRNVGIGIVVSIVIYFVINKNFKEILYSIVSIFIFQIPYSLYKTLYWNLKGAGFKGQLDEMFYIDPYNHALGKEDFNGFVARFVENSQLYLSKHFSKTLGLLNPDSTDKSVLVTILVYLLFFTTIIIAFKKKNKYMQAIAIYLAVAVGATFVSQQIMWDQGRLVLIYIPLILILFGYGIYELARIKRLRFLQVLLPILFVIIILSTFSQTVQKAKANTKVLQKHMEGNPYIGFTPDWVHYFQMSEWVSSNLPENSVVACRKPSMSFIYGKGKEFFPVYKVPVVPVDTIIQKVQNASKTVDIIVLDYLQLRNTKVPAELLEKYRLYIKYLLINEEHIYVVYYLTPQTKSTLLAAIQPYNLNINTEVNIIAKEAKTYGADPDGLLNYLKNNNVKYIILASLRADPSANTGNVIDTLHRIVSYIQLKYPDQFRVIYQIGTTPEDEPAQLLEVL